MCVGSEAPEEVARGPRRKGFGVGAVLGRRVLLLLVAAIMAVMMSMGTALAANNGGTGGGFNGGAGGSGGQHVKHNFKKNKLCLVKYKGHYRYVPCYYKYYW